MNLNSFINKETITKVAAGTIGGLSTLPLKKFVTSKVPFLKEKELYQDIAGLVLGIGVAAFSKNSNVKTLGLGMSLVSGFNMGKGLLENAGIGDVFINGTDDAVFMGDTSEPVLMGASGDVSNYASDSIDTTSSAAGEMNY